MESLHFLIGGFETALQPGNLVFALIGCVLGTLVGILPGIGPVAGTAILILMTFGLDPTAAIIMLAAIYYGAMYGGTLTSVLVNVPGEAASVITCLDGYAMARQGRAGPALAIAALGSFFAGTVSTMGLVLLALPLTALALRFGPPEVFALMLVGLSLVTGLASTSFVRAMMSAILGLLIAMVGIDPVMGAPASPSASCTSSTVWASCRSRWACSASGKFCSIPKAKCASVLMRSSARWCSQWRI